jgi:uncharacterized membrane protein YoaK (UPF0700 family)
MSAGWHARDCEWVNEAAPRHITVMVTDQIRKGVHPMAVPSPLGTRQTVAALLILTVVTGLVDAVSYLRLGHVFVANMTGNVVFLGFQRGPALRTVRDRLILAVAALLTGTAVLPFTGHGSLVTIVILAAALGVQNSTVRHLGAPDLTTTVLTLTITGLAADSALVGGPSAKPHRRLSSIAAMLAGAVAGAGILQWSATAAIAAAAVLVATVAVMFTTAARRSPQLAPAPPTPSSRTWTRRQPSTAATSTSTPETQACFVALVSISETT